VTIDGSTFGPSSVTVNKGDTVRWVNKDPFPHTATAAGTFDSKSIAAGGQWSWRASKSGEFPYICTLHPNMKGTVKVQ
jgi:plastocyanin